MESINTRISQVITALKLSKNQFSKEIGTSSAMISKITGNKTNFGIEIIEKIVSKYPQLNFNWILTGFGEMWLQNHNYKPQEHPQLSAKSEPFPVSKKPIEKSVYKPRFTPRERMLLSDNETKVIEELKEIDINIFELIMRFERIRDVSDGIADTYFTELFDAKYNSANYLNGKKFDYVAYRKEVYKTFSKYSELQEPLKRLTEAFEQFLIEFKPFDNKNILDEYEVYKP